MEENFKLFQLNFQYPKIYVSQIGKMYIEIFKNIRKVNLEAKITNMNLSRI